MDIRISGIETGYLGVTHDVDAAMAGADVVLHPTEWPEFAHLDATRAARLVRCRHVIDGRTGLDPEPWLMAGWTFHARGRRTPSALQDVRQPDLPQVDVTGGQESILEWI